MQANTIINFLSKEGEFDKKRKKIFRIHKMGTAHEETLKRFLFDSNELSIYSHKDNNNDKNKYFIKLLNGFEKNHVNSISNSTFEQYIRVLVFYGIVDFHSFGKDQTFGDIMTKIEKCEQVSKLKFTISSDFSQNISLVAGNIANQLHSPNDSISKNAKTFLFPIWILRELNKSDKELNEENIKSLMNESFGEGEWKICGMKNEDDMKWSKIIESIEPFDKKEVYPFDSEINPYIEIINLITIFDYEK